MKERTRLIAVRRTYSLFVASFTFRVDFSYVLTLPYSLKRRHLSHYVKEAVQIYFIGGIKIIIRLQEKSCCHDINNLQTS